MDKRKFMSNAALLVITTFLLRLVFTAFRVVVSNKVGAECMGLYQLTFAVYGISVTLATSGINFACTRLTSQTLATKKYSLKQIMGKCSLYALLFSVISMILIYNFAEMISVYLLCDIRCTISLKIFAASLPFISLSSAITGFFYALKKVKITLYSRILEQTVQIISFFILFYFVPPKNIEIACAVIVLSSAIAEVFGSIYLILKAISYKERKLKKQKKVFSKICSIGLPTAFGAYLRSGLQTLENTLVPIGFRKFGATQSDALKGYGTLCSMVMPIIFFPSFVLSAFSMLLIPEITYAQTLEKNSEIRRSTDFTVKLTLYFSLVVAANFICFGSQLGQILYSSDSVGSLIRVMAPLIPFMYLDSIADSLLKGLGEYNRVIAYSTVDAVISILLILFVVPKMGLYGYILVIYISTMINSTLSIARLLKITDNKLLFVKDILSPFLLAFACEFLPWILIPIGKDGLIFKIIVSNLLFALIVRKFDNSVYKTFSRAISLMLSIFGKRHLMGKKSISNSHKKTVKGEK